MKRAHIKIIFVVFVHIVVLVYPAFGQNVIYVDDDAPMGGNGISWDTAYKYLQDALAHANDLAPEPVEVHVAAGVYKPDQSEVHPTVYGYFLGDREATFVIPSGVTVRGAYYGLPTLRTSAVVLSGDLAGNDVEVTSPELLSGEPTRLDNSFHVVRMKDASVLAGVVVTGGYAHQSRASNPYGMGFSSDHGGGGVWINGNDTTLRDCLITGNYAEEVGGGVWCTHAKDVSLVNCTLSDNGTRFWGGGTCVIQSEMSLNDCTISNNWAGNEGGGSYVSSTEILMTNCSIAENKAYFVDLDNAISSGGGLFFRDAKASIVDCIINWTFAI